MRICLEDADLLRFLAGEMDAEDDARIVLHVEHCDHCQERLERLTFARPWQVPGPSGREASSADRQDSTRGGMRSVTHSWCSKESCGNRSFEPGSRALVKVGNGRAFTTIEWPGDGVPREPDKDGGRVAPTDRDPTQDTDRSRPRQEPGRSTSIDRLGKEPVQWPTFPGYEVCQRLGEGGMAVVYKARQHRLNRWVALKMVHGGGRACPDHLVRFQVEAEAVAQLDHPHIIQIYEIGETEKVPFLAMELLEGPSLEARLAEGPYPDRAAAELVASLAGAIQVAHDAGIIHRDLKPSNILYNSEGIPKVADFGLAKRIGSDDGPTQSGQIMGSPSYMAPEQARGDSRHVGPEADVYALGAMLYVMLTGRPPFKGDNPMETVRQVVEEDVVPPSRLSPRLARDLETICLKCLQKSPSRRYRSARELADDLGRFLAGEPIAARQTPPWVRLVRLAKRRPATVLTGALTVLLLVGAIAGLFAIHCQSLRRGQLIEASVNEASRLAWEVDSARSSVELEEARIRIAGLLHRLEAFADDPRIEGLSDSLARKQQRLGSQLATLRSEQVERERLAEGVRRFQAFRQLLNEAMFHETRFTGLDLPGDETEARRAATAALGLYASSASDDSWTLGPLPTSLSTREQAEIVEGCYLLLMVLSGTEPNPRQGLRRLDEASRLHPAPTRAFLLRLASCLERVGDRPRAERERRVAETIVPSTASDYYLLGLEHFERRDRIAAIRNFEQAMREQPDHFWAQCLWAICSLELGRPEEARAGFNACLIREREFAWLYILRGLASGLTSPRASPEDARIRIQAAEADYHRALALLERNQNKGLHYVALVNRGLLRAQAGDRRAAEADLRQAIELGDAKTLASSALAGVLAAEGRFDEALALYAAAIERRPDWSALYRGRAEVILAMKKAGPALRSQALADLDRAIRLEGLSCRIVARDQTNRGRLLAAEGNDTEALAACEAAIERAGDYEDAHRLRLDLLRRMKRPEEVIRSCDPLIKRHTTNPMIYEQRGLARVDLRDFAAAIGDFTRAIELGGDRPKLLRRRAWGYLLADAPRLAWNDFDEAIRLDPSVADAYNGRALTLVRLGEHRRALADAEAAVSLREPTPEVLYKSARSYCLAATAVSTQGRTIVGGLPIDVIRYHDRAFDLLREAVRRVPIEKRPSFLKDVLLSDPALRPLSRRIASMDLKRTPSAGEKISVSTVLRDRHVRPIADPPPRSIR